MSTYVPTPSSIERQWHVIDAGEQVLGRIATVAARLLQGKHKPRYAPFLDTGDFVIITNAKTVKLTGCLLYTSPSPRDRTRSRMPSSA